MRCQASSHHLVTQIDCKPADLLDQFGRDQRNVVNQRLTMVGLGVQPGMHQHQTDHPVMVCHMVQVIEIAIQTEVALLEVKVETTNRKIKTMESQAAEHAKYERKMAGCNTQGSPPAMPSAHSRDIDKVNFTNEQSRIIKTSRGFEQCYIGQTGVVADGGILQQEQREQVQLGADVPV